MVIQYLLYDNTYDNIISSISKISDYFTILFERADYRNIKLLYFVNI
jgi:hypothetical protein